MTNSKRVKLDGRTFIVDFDDAGDPLRIKERKTFGTYPLDGLYNAPYWSARHHKPGSSKTIVSRVIAAAQTASP